MVYPLSYITEYNTIQRSNEDANMPTLQDGSSVAQIAL